MQFAFRSTILCGTRGRGRARHARGRWHGGGTGLSAVSQDAIAVSQGDRAVFTRSIRRGRRRDGVAAGSCGGCCSPPTSSGSCVAYVVALALVPPASAADRVAPDLGGRALRGHAAALGSARAYLRPLRPRRGANRSLDGRRRRRRLPGRDARNVELPRHHARPRPAVPEPRAARRLLAPRRCAHSAPARREPRDRPPAGRVHPERHHRRLGRRRAPARRQDREASGVRPAGRRVRRSRRRAIARQRTATAAARSIGTDRRSAATRSRARRCTASRSPSRPTRTIRRSA